ncbi:MAG: hypothetical protein AB1752_01480 [Candidatus Zixiibacteriota bacterium]
MEYDTSSFLPHRELRPGDFAKAEGLTPLGMYLGAGQSGLEVVVYRGSLRPSPEVMKRLWKERRAGRKAAVLVVVLQGDRCTVCGHTGTDKAPPPVIRDLPIAHVETLCSTALDLTDEHAVDRFLREQLPEAESPIFGIRNQGLLATHIIQRGRAEFERQIDLWDTATKKAGTALSEVDASAADRDRKLLRALGYGIEPLEGPASLLTDKGAHTAVAIFLEQSETPELQSSRFGGASPISYAMTHAQKRSLKWVIVARGSELRLYPTATDIGVGRRGLANTYLQINTDLLPDDRQAFLWLVFSAEGLSPAGLLTTQLLEKSDRYAKDIGERLRDRIYTTVIPQLAMSIAQARKLRKPSKADLDLTYQMAMLVLFRILFIAYAEDHDLLPYRTNESYRDRSLTHLARELKRIAAGERGFDAGTTRWKEMVLLWDSIREGNDELGIPAYDGGLFDEDTENHQPGAELKKIELSNRDFGVVLTNLLLDPNTPEGLGPVDFRSLGVREFGTIYEGLLESELASAETDLATDKQGSYKPAGDRDAVVVRKGDFYLHNRSGARKSSGSYYTKDFAVEHLLTQSLEPALDAHLEKIATLAKTDPDSAARQLFEFYVADIAMGSGHFLVNAIDRMEKRFVAFLTDHKLPGVTTELDKLADQIRKECKDHLDETWLEKNRLLRRLIARRCIYGVDLNPLAVELSRLSIWIHTFVPGLPLSFLDHNLVCGNSLVGIATFEEALEETIEQGANLGLFDDPAKRLMAGAVEPIRELRSLSDTNVDDVKRAGRAHIKAQKALSGLTAFFDILTAARFDPELVEKMRAGAAGMLANLTKVDTLFGHALHTQATKAMTDLPPFHFPVAFPEVFLRDEPGFDVIVGNPPWQEATIEENAFWARHFPRLRGMRQSDQEVLKEQYRRERSDLVQLYQHEKSEAETLRRVLTSGPFPGMGTGDPDFYKAFAWRFWHLLRDGGWIAVVLPRSAWFAKGSEQFRMEVFQRGKVTDLLFLLNSGGWVFDEAEHRYTIALSTVERSQPPKKNATIAIRGPYRSRLSFDEGVERDPVSIKVADVVSWTDSAALPLLPTEESAEVFLQLRKAPRLDSDAGGWRCRPYTELHATNDKHLMTVTADQPKGYWPVFKGESFDIWNPDTGKYYAWVDPKKICTHLQEKRERGHNNARSVFSEFSDEWIEDPETLPCRHPRIAFRDITRATDQRTVRAALVPPGVVIVNQAPTLLWPDGDQQDEVFMLGVLCSIPLDWYSRRFVETHLNFHVLNPFPIPRPGKSSALWQRTVALAGRLACPDKRFATWAKAVGVKCGQIPEDEKNDMISELDAVVAHLYGLSEKQLRHIFETFHEGWEYEGRLREVLGHYREWKGKG